MNALGHSPPLSGANLEVLPTEKCLFIFRIHHKRPVIQQKRWWMPAALIIDNTEEGKHYARQDAPILTQLATYMSLERRRPFFIKNR